MRRAARKDLNHDVIADAFRQNGWDVIDAYQFADVCPGFPDLIVLRDGAVFFVEVKGPNGKLTEAEREFHRRFARYCVVARDERDVLRLTNIFLDG